MLDEYRPPLDPQRWTRVIEAFSAAVERTPGAERDSYLISVLGDDSVLIQEVEAMLRAHEDMASLAVEKRLLRGEGDETDLSGRLIGAYRLVRLVATGGMGEVYAAERERAPFRQQVALKLLRDGLRGPEATMRFRQERQILARLVHPLIVPLLDGGVTPEGQPYLVLQYVDGKPVTTYCNRRGCGIEERLRLFLEIARAVQFAHRNLVVHRDLKPSNVLVTDDGEVRLLDFGVAKLLEGSASDDAPVTLAESRIMTLEYAAPEQVRGGAITIGTDVYGLGVLLYEVLTGRRPFAADAGGRRALERRILQDPPERPSAAARGPKDTRWAKRLRGDLDTIVLKAMAKEPEQRYSSAADFAADIERFLARKPILARKQSWRYHLGKFVRRNRLATAVGCVAVLVVLVLTATIWRQAEHLAGERDLARAEQLRADHVVSLLVDLFSTANPEHRPGGGDIMLGEFLNNAENAILQQRGLDPGVQARLRHTIGKVFLARSQYRQARTHLEAALFELRKVKGESDPAVAEAFHDLAKLALESRTAAEAVPLLRQSLQLHRRIYGESHPLVARCMQDLGTALADRRERRTMLEGALAVRRKWFPSPHIDVAESLDTLGTFHFETGDMSGAQREFEEGLRILQQAAPEGHPLTLSVMNDLSAVLVERGRFQEAEALARTLLVARRRFIGGETLPVAVTWGNLGAVLAHLGRHAEAEQSFRNAHALLVKLLGPEHWQAANAARNLARIRLLRGDNAEALEWFRKAVEVQRRVAGSDANYWFMRGQAAVATARTGRTTQAVRELRLVLDRLVALGVHASRTAEARIALGFLLLDTGKNAEAAALFREALDSRRSDTPGDHPSIAEAECAFGVALATRGKPEGRLLVERNWPGYRAWGLADPVYSARMRRWLTPR